MVWEMVDLSLQAGEPNVASFGARVQAFFKPLAPEWRYGRIIFVALILWYLSAQIIHIYLGGNSRTSMADTKWLNIDVLVRLFEFMVVLGIVRFIQLRKRVQNTSFLRSLATGLKPRPMDILRWILWSVVCLIAFAVFLSNIMSIKTTIPEFVPFYFDPIAMKIDRALFFGHDAWEIVAPIYKIQGIVILTDLLYAVVWPIILAGCWYYSFTSKAMDIHRRYQFSLAIILAFIIGGNILAIVFSSVGPIYFETYYGSDHFAQIGQELGNIGKEVPLHATKLQARLLEFANDPDNPINGISAVPSMHIATTVLMLTLFWRTPLARMVTFVFTVFIGIGSIMMGWHYAIDGLFAIPIAIGCWYLAGWILHKYAGAPNKAVPQPG